MIYWFTVRILHDYCRKNKIQPKSSDEESPQSADDNKSNENTECDCKLLQLKTDEMEVSVAEINASNAKFEASIAEIKASNAEIRDSNAKFEASIAEIKASNTEIKGLLEDLLKGRSSK